MPLPTVPQSSLTKQGFAQANNPLGATAKAPTQNLTEPSNALPTSQTASGGLPKPGQLSSQQLMQQYPGYSFNAQGTLTNNAGQAYQAPNQAPSATTQNIPSLSGPTPSQSSGSLNPANGITKAPEGQEYGPTGLLQPKQGYSATNQATYPGLINQLANTASAPTTQFTNAQNTAGQAATGLLNSGNTQNEAYQYAVQDYQKAQQALQESRTNEANALSLNSQNPIPLEFQQGRGQVLQNQYLQQQTALAQQMAAAQGLGNMGTAQQSAQQAAFTGAGSTANAAAGAATGQQSAQQQGLSNAVGATQPQLGQYGQAYYNPLQAGMENGGGSLNPMNNIQSLAQQVISGQLSPQQAYAMGGSVANFQGALNAAIQQAHPGFNTAQSQGRYDATQANTQTSGVTPVNAAASVYGQSYQQLLDLKNTTSNVDQFGTLLLNSMKDANGNQINPSDIKFANQTLSQIRGALSSQQQAVFDNTFASLKSRVSGLLAMGGSEIPTQITSDANKILDGSLPFSSLSAVLQRITTEGGILTNNLQNKLNTSGSVIGAPKSGGSLSYQDYLKAIGQ